MQLNVHYIVRKRLKHSSSLFYSFQNLSLLHAGAIWSIDLCDLARWAQHLLQSKTRTGKVLEAGEADSSYGRWSVETELMN